MSTAALINTGIFLKQSAPITRLFWMVQSSDHLTPLTGATPAVKICKGNNPAVVATNSPAAQVDAVNAPGLYAIVLANADVSLLGNLAIVATATGGDPAGWVDNVVFQTASDLQLDASGRVLIASQLRMNQPVSNFAFTFVSASTGAPVIGATGIVAQRNFGGGWVNCVNSVTELGNGDYAINLAAADTNFAGGIMYRFTGAGVSDVNISVVTVP